MRVPTDLKILECIYKCYYKDFVSFEKGKEGGRASKIYVPIDCKLVARKLKVDPDIVFGRLYNYLNEKYAYKNQDGSLVLFFSLNVGGDSRCIHFSLLASAIAELKEAQYRFRLPIGISIAALSISIVSLVITIIDL